MLLEHILQSYARRFPLRRGKYRIIERFGARPDGKGSFIRRSRLQYGGFLMDCDLRMQLQRQFHYFGTYYLEDKIIGAWSHYARNASVIFDVGANAGIYSLAAAAASPGAAIHAFEPTPEIVDHLEGTVELNGLADCLNVQGCAVGKERGRIFLNRFSGEKNDNEGMNFVSDVGRGAETIEVPIVSLDSFCEENGISGIDLLKVDVQGHEPAVFEGAKGLLKRKALRTIFLELNWNHAERESCPARKAVQLLAAAGFRFADANAGDRRFKEAGPWLESLSDVVASTSFPG